MFKLKKLGIIIIGVLVIIYIKNFGVVGRVIDIDKNDGNIYVQLEYSDDSITAKSAYIHYDRCENYQKDDKVFAICNINRKINEPAYVNAIIVLKLP